LISAEQPISDVIVSGVKKCGTKTVQTFLLSHPKIIGSRAETHYWSYSDSFTRNLASWFWRMGKALDTGVYLVILNFPKN